MREGPCTSQHFTYSSRCKPVSAVLNIVHKLFGTLSHELGMQERQ